MKRFILIILTSLIFNNIGAKSYLVSEKAICIAPVVDLLNVSAQLISPYTNPKSIYSAIPFSPEQESNDSAYLTCLRVHQALFNEEVEILEELDHEVKIQINTAFYHISRNNFKKNSYWALKSNFKKLNELDVDKIPETIDCNKTNYDELPKQKIIILTLPFYDKTTEKNYSVGTRFVYKNKDESFYIVYIYDVKSNKIVETKISKNVALEFQKETNEKKIQNFINLIKLWTHYNNKPLPYVWGGSSMQQLPSTTAQLKKQVCNMDNCISTKNCQNMPHSGFDCSGLILRAAQICRIPYFFKDCLTINKHLDSIQQEDQIKAGDLIWFCGHIIVISDVRKNMCIEARGYTSGHGKLHEIEVGKIFKDINTFEQLKECHLKETQIQVINKFGKVSRTLNKFRILKLNSVFKFGN
ncbi:MAG: hypothetical protein P4L22_02285 [Candidatus Babeliales bacterium]|nr:hypothetical protein [Candidatus Babeliales bacterium]